MEGPRDALSWTRLLSSIAGIILIIGGIIAFLYGMAMFMTIILIPWGALFMVAGSAAVIGGLALMGVVWLPWRKLKTTASEPSKRA